MNWIACLIELDRLPVVIYGRRPAGSFGTLSAGRGACSRSVQHIAARAPILAGPAGLWDPPSCGAGFPRGPVSCGAGFQPASRLASRLQCPGPPTVSDIGTAPRDGAATERSGSSRCVLAATTRLGHRSLECHPLTFISMGGPQGHGDSLQSRLGNNTRPLPAVVRVRNLQYPRRAKWAILPNVFSNYLILKGNK